MAVVKNGTTAVHQHRINGSLGELTYSVFDWEESGTLGDLAVPVQSIDATLELPVNLTGQESAAM